MIGIRTSGLFVIYECEFCNWPYEVPRTTLPLTKEEAVKHVFDAHGDKILELLGNLTILWPIAKFMK